MRRVVSMSALVLALGLPRLAGAQADPLGSPALSVQRAELSALVEALQAQGIPTDSILAKLREGVAKHVPGPLIARAAQTVAERLRIAASLARPASSGARRSAIVVLAEALEAGIGRGDLVRLERSMAGVSSSALLLAVEAATELRDRGFGGSAAVDAVREAYQSGGTGSFRRLLRDVAAGGFESSADRDERLLGAARGAGRDREREEHDVLHGWGHTKAGSGGR
jgi:hypothetical protein